MSVSHRFSRIFHPQYLHAPKNIQSQSFTEDTSPLYFEIGAGKGKHALSFAQSHPESRLMAVERTHEKSAAFNKQFNLNKLNNLAVIQADAIAFAVHFIQPNSLDGVFLLYPNPEPHNKNQRWLNMPFFEFLLSRMKVGASIILVSNIESYIEEACKLLEEVWLLPYERFEVESTSARTHFEIKYLARGERCQELKITKPAEYRTRFDDFSAMSLPKL